MHREIWSLLVAWSLVSPECAAQTYPYTMEPGISQTYPTATYLYDSGFTVYGNVKSVAVAAHGQATDPASAPAIEVYVASYSYPSASPTTTNKYSLAATLRAVSTPGTAATRLGYAVEGGQSVKTSEVIVGTTIYDSAAGLYSAGVGAAYVFKQYSSASWSQTARLQPSDLSDGTADKFGASVGIDEFDPTRIMVGAPYAGTLNSGAVYFYQSSPTAKYWTEGQKLMPNVQNANGRFGDKVEIFGRFAAITEPDTCKVYIFEQEKPEPAPKPKPSCGKSSPTPAPVTSTWQPLVQHETLRWSQQQILFNDSPGFECNVGGRSETFGDGNAATFDTSPTGTHDPQYGSPTGSGYGGYFSISMFDDTLAVGVPGYEETNRVRTDYYDAEYDPDLCRVTCVYDIGGNFQSRSLTYNPTPGTYQCCPSYPSTCPGPAGAGTFPAQNGGRLYLGQCPDYPYAPGDNGRVYMYDMETFKGDCDRENYFPTVLSFDELMNLRDKKDDDEEEEGCEEDHHHVHKPKPKPQCEVSRWSMQTYLRSPSNNFPSTDPRYADCQNFGYKVDVYKDVLTVNEVNTLSFDIYTDPSPTPTSAPVGHDPFVPGIPFPAPLPAEYHCMSNLYWPLYNADVNTDQPLVKKGYVYAYEQTSANTWSHLGSGAAPGYEMNTDPVGVESSTTLVSGTDMFTMESSATGYVVDIQTTDNTWKCMVVTLMDQFGDGWGGAELQITDSDGRKQTFAPYCDSPATAYPFVYDFRWCPDDWEHGDEVKMEILHSPSTKFRWEIEWSVYFEWNKQVVYGKWDTKMALSYDTVGSQVLRLKHAEHLTNTTAACVRCGMYTPTPTMLPTSKPPPPKPKPRPPTSLPTLSVSKSGRALYTDTGSASAGAGAGVDVDAVDKIWDGVEPASEDPDPLDDVEEAAALSIPRTHLRHLHHKTKASVRTHSPTVSPAPTMPTTAFTTWEQVALTGSVTTGSRAGWDRPYTTGAYAAANIPMKYFISDKEGKHLFYEGTKCVASDVTCWADLPPGDRDYILRVGGAATSAPTPASTWTMCGRTGGKMEQLDFRVKDYITSIQDSAECSALFHTTRARYCSTTLALVVPTSGIIVLEGLILDSFSKMDLELLGHAISQVFSPTTLLEVTFTKHMHSSRGAHVGFTVDVPSSVFGLDATEFDSINATSAQAFHLLRMADFSSSIDTLLLEYSSKNIESSLNKHGKIYIEDLSIASEVTSTFVADPYYYVVEDDDAQMSEVGGLSNAADESSVLFDLMSAIQDHMFVFLAVMAGLAVLYVRSKNSDNDDDFDEQSYLASKKKSRKYSSLKLPLTEESEDRTSSHSKKGKHEDRDGKDHKHRHKHDKTAAPHTAASTLKARASMLDSYVSEVSEKGGNTSSNAIQLEHSAAPRFVPYGSAAKVAVEEGWAGSAAQGGSRPSSSSGGRSGARAGSGSESGTGGAAVSNDGQRDDQDDDDSDELDHILSHFDSSSSSSSGESDGWEHA